MKNFSDFLNEDFVNESTGGYIAGVIDNLRQFAEDPNQWSGTSSESAVAKAKADMVKAVDDLEKVFKKALKEKGLSGW